ncbi:MAG: hypothetical protein J5747_01230 [Spirochaetaceae bacterium]|nr:hypothetical protein [Spirochaetaceae bacterium]MBO4704740.1 hypothetical protein [Spirochaetaceae bacterium]
MKKRFILIGIILALVIAPVAAMDIGVNFNAGVRPSMVNVYLYEDVAFRMEFNDTFGAEVGVDLMENFAFAPYLYFSPYISFYADGFYLTGGVLFHTRMNSIEDVYPWGEVGWRFGDWQMGPGIGNVDVGVNISPTIALAETGDDLGDALGSIFATIFNMLKLKVGFSWYLPIK